MKYIILLFFVLTILPGVFSCRNRQNDSQILIKVKRSRSSNPDSILILLKNNEKPAKRDKKQYATYRPPVTKDNHAKQPFYLFFICFSVVFLIPFIAILIIKKNKKHRPKSLEKHQKLLFLEEMLESKNNTENKLKELLIEKLDITKKVVLMQSYTNINDGEFVKQFYKTFGKNISEILEWDKLYPIFDELYNNFTSKLKLNFPTLTEKEFQHCCLIRAGFNREEVCLFLSYEYNSIRTSKLRIRKKMGFDTFEDFTEYLNNL